MIFNGIYKTKIELKNVTITAENLKQLIEKLTEQEMDYNLEVEFLDGDSLTNIKLDKLLDFQYKTKQIKELQLRANSKNVSVWLYVYTDDSWSYLNMDSMDNAQFYKVKTILQDWVKSIQNENKLSYLQRDNFRGYISRYIVSLFATFAILTLIVFSFEPWNNFDAWMTVITSSFGLSFIAFFIITAILYFYFRLVEIDICYDKFKKRRKTAYWLLTIIIIPIATNIICNLL